MHSQAAAGSMSTQTLPPAGNRHQNSEFRKWAVRVAESGVRLRCVLQKLPKFGGVRGQSQRWNLIVSQSA